MADKISPCPRGQGTKGPGRSRRCTRRRFPQPMQAECQRALLQREANPALPRLWARGVYLGCSEPRGTLQMLWESSSYRRALVAVPNVCPIPRGNAWSTSLRPNLRGRTWILHEGFGNVCWMPRSIFHLELNNTQLDGAELITDLNTPRPRWAGDP